MSRGKKIFLVAVLLGLLLAHCASALREPDKSIIISTAFAQDNKSSTSESTLPPHLTQIVKIGCEWQTEDDKGKTPKSILVIHVAYKDESWPVYKEPAGTFWGKDWDEADEKAYKACRDWKKRVKEAIKEAKEREQREQARASRNRN